MTTQLAKPLNWSVTSHDYSTHRPGYPDNFFHLLQHLGIGLHRHHILDIGSGTGALAIPFAQQGAYVTAADRSPGQIDAASEKAARDCLDIRFIVSDAEDVQVEAGYFHAVTASMCWGYFDKKRIVDLVKRVLREDGLLMISSIIWLSDYNEITRQTEALIGRYNEDFGTRGTARDDAVIPEWSAGEFRLKTYHQYVANIPFTRESWRGRLRASKWIGAALQHEKVEAFDRELATILEKIAPETFEIPHTIRIQIFQRLSD